MGSPRDARRRAGVARLSGKREYESLFGWRAIANEHIWVCRTARVELLVAASGQRGNDRAVSLSPVTSRARPPSTRRSTSHEGSSPITRYARAGVIREAVADSGNRGSRTKRTSLLRIRAFSRPLRFPSDRDNPSGWQPYIHRRGRHTIRRRLFTCSTPDESCAKKMLPR